MNKALKWVPRTIFALLFIAGISIFIKPTNKEDSLGNVNIPDRCVLYDQVASRSIKAAIKTAPGKVYSYRVTSTATDLKYFQLHDQTAVPVGASVPEYSTALSGTTASNSPITISESFSTPLRFESGIGFSISPNFATFASTSTFNNRFTVDICYE